jgi:hypothetical protein
MLGDAIFASLTTRSIYLPSLAAYCVGIVPASGKHCMTFSPK